MEIQLTDKYRLVAQDFGWDIQELVNRKKEKSGEKYQQWEAFAYNVSIPSAIQRVVHIHLKDKQVTLSLQEFLKEYKQERDKILGILEENKVA